MSNKAAPFQSRIVSAQKDFLIAGAHLLLDIKFLAVHTCPVQKDIFRPCNIGKLILWSDV
ncbi:hypothetical protein S4054249_22475 [Pseudoalteromonas luteoviolacea]|uniref:Uncharacterized protein n=1 Tax=Pseudoalteromonas luteoviolacea S4054 TaxID=1129367 RepID=A0A0F6ABX6_9GAMM|nr:hypothetical protein S4054249_22475 [Pseudoalteromonas luteoviolacea]AOT15303.1 hypothetical protein S40542_21120 [Pseudoalteromonas luteoviolacea]AOT20448.1 hypothetical protein S4054_22390 [Pseudoalteromonas luteoviolacea]KKE83727.1 hypothetical protein N479_12940 [Pseudoalteromonas luteoviolacea S4054]KZN71931.1 hypothetical protein N481_17305 [Pseudoalteromonas luteoviolacea S4047-1]